MPEERLAQQISRAIEGDQRAFDALVEPRRVALFRHCYRMLGSGPDAEEAVQDTLLRAWQRLSALDAAKTLDGWLYRIATNLCIDRLRRAPKRVHPVGYGSPSSVGEPLEGPKEMVDWVEPIAEVAVGLPPAPEQSALQRERVSLAFVAALHQLSPRQRAALLLHDVLEFSHAEVADMLDSTRSAVNSLLSRARETIQSSALTAPPDPDDPEVRALLGRYVKAWELGDIAAFVATVSDDVRFSMPPLATWYEGSENVAAFVEAAVFSQARPHGVPVVLGRANGQPAMAVYEPSADGAIVVSGLQVLDIAADGSAVIAITSFRSGDLAERCGFPAVLD